MYQSCLRYLAARNFMLSGTGTFTPYDKSKPWWVWGFQAFILSPSLIFWSKKLIWWTRYGFFLFQKLLLKNAKTLLAFFNNDFRNKKNPYRVHQINFLLQNINDGDKMKAWKPQTHHSLLLSYGGKVPVPDSMKFLAARYLKPSSDKSPLILSCSKWISWAYFRKK